MTKREIFKNFPIPIKFGVCEHCAYLDSCSKILPGLNKPNKCGGPFINNKELIMTQEEKAKAYDDAIKRAKRMFSEKELNYLFPELAESDDEKIISAIRKAIEAKVENLGNGVTRTACLAWLEKQGEQKVS